MKLTLPASEDSRCPIAMEEARPHLSTKKPPPPRRKNDRHCCSPLLLSLAAVLITAAAVALSSSKRGTAAGAKTTGLLQETCSMTLYPHLCFATLSAASPTAAKPNLADVTVAAAAASIKNALLEVRRRLLPHYRRDPAVDDCVYMLRHSLGVLESAVVAMRRGNFHRARTLLSAAMTDQDTCLDGCGGRQRKVRKRFEKLLTPISQTVSNALAIAKELETEAERKEPRIRPAARRRGPMWMRVRERRLLVGLARPPPDAVVSQNGTGRYRTITAAVAAAPRNSRRRFVIWIKSGTYNETVEVPVHKTNLVFIGDGISRTIITGCKSAATGYTTFKSATVSISGGGFMARDLSIINTSGPLKGQAVALRVNADLSAFYRVNISGYQDTLYAHSLSQFYRECTISGTVDFVFGNAAAVFQNCAFLARRPRRGQKNMVTAQGRDDPNQPTGFSIQNCSVTAEEEGRGPPGFETYLGRPWRRYARTMVMGSYLGEVVHPRGWHEWSEARPLEKVEMWEYGNRGPGAATERRVRWARTNATAEVAMRFAVGELIGGRWLNATAYPFSFGL